MANRPGPLVDTPALLDGLKNEYLARWTKKAQRQAVIEWRDRTQGPGVLARFTKGGADFYDQSDRPWKYRRRKGDLPNYVYSGKFREQLRKRGPRSPRTGGDSVVTTFSILGGPLNFHRNHYGLRHSVVSVRRELVRVRGHSRRSKTGKAYSVRPYVQEQTHTVADGALSTRSYAEEFEITAADIRWITARTDVLREQIVRKATLRKGGALKRGARAMFNDLDAFREKQGLDP